MTLTVCYGENNDTCSKKQTVIASYDPKTACTTVDTDTDIVTLGVTAAVVQADFNARLNAYDADTQKQIINAIYKAIEGVKKQ